jgi:tetratricopeptide (TPR) repeat protein
VTALSVYFCRMRLSAALLMPALVLAMPAAAQAFREIEVGSQLRNRDLPALDGKKAPLLGTARANVFVFFRTGQDHSAEALAQFASLEAEFAGKSVRIVGVVSDADPREDVLAMVRAAGVRMPVLVDVGDALYGELGVALHPSIGIADARHKLVGYQAFRRINLLDALRGRIQLALGEISEAQFAAVLDPEATEVAVNRAKARMNLARKLLEAGDVDGAVASARAAVELEPGRPDTHALLAEVLAKAGQCEESSRESKEARFIDPGTTATFVCRR